MATIINIQAAKTHLSRLVEQVAAGEEIVLAKAGKPMARLVPYIPARQPRVGGFFAGKITASADIWASDHADFDTAISAPLYQQSDDDRESQPRCAEE